MQRSICVLLISGLLATAAWADPAADATKLKEEAVDILKANAQRQASPEQYAECIIKLEQAQQILEKAGADDTPLAQEVSSSLFWARRFSDVNVLKALDKLRAGAPPPPPVKHVDAPAKKEPEQPQEPGAPPAPPPPNQEDIKAKAAFDIAQKFAQEHSSDDYAVALRYFQMASENPGTDYALKALDLARSAQQRFADKTAKTPEEALPDTPEMKLVVQADDKVKEGKYEESFALYMASIKLKETLIAHRKLGKAYYKRGAQMKEEVLPKIEKSVDEVNTQYKKAFELRQTRMGRYWRFNPNYPPYVEAVKKNQELVKEAMKAIDLYDKASSEFKAVLKLAPDNKDLEAAGTIGVCMSVRGDPNARSLARNYLVKFLADYKPANDLEKSLYEFCKTELDRINGKKS